MTEGTVKWFNDAKGYGFISCDDKAGEVFVHFSSIKGEGYRTLDEGRRVRFEIEQGARGPQARDVEVISQAREF